MKRQPCTTTRRASVLGMLAGLLMCSLPQATLAGLAKASNAANNPATSTNDASSAASTKDIVLDRINRPQSTGGGVVVQDAMVVSVLVESVTGTLTPRATNALFRTGERFRVKVLSSRDGRMALYNTNPKGQTTEQPLWRGDVRRGQELVTPRLRLEGNQGTDLLHVVLEPAPTTAGSSVATAARSVYDWVVGVARGTVKDIRLDVQNTSSATYLLGAAGQGMLTTLRITHR